MSQSVLDAHAANRLIAILRYHEPNDVDAAVRALADSCRSSRSPWTVRTPWSALELTASEDRLMIGASTVTEPDEVRRAEAPGAPFVVSPGSPADVVATATECRGPRYQVWRLRPRRSLHGAQGTRPITST